MSRKIAIASGKGGTGKSTFAANLGMTLAFDGSRVLLLDMNIGLRTLDLYLGVQNEAIFDIEDVISGSVSFVQATVSSSVCDNLVLLPAYQGLDESRINVENFQSMLDEIEEEFDYVLFDCPPGVGPFVDLSAECADEVIFVINADYAALRDADTLEDRLIRQGVFKRSYVVNGLESSLIEMGVSVELSELDERMRCDLLGIIPYDFNIKASTNEGVPITIKRDTYIAENYKNIAKRIIAKW